jgi:magnesium chelatase subunit D
VSFNFPFAAIVGQEQLKTALLLCAVNPSIGGVLIRGDKGTAKSTAARGLAEVLLPIERVPGCAFNCIPGEAHELCDVCKLPESNPQTAPVPFVNLPLGATEDRVLGSLDFERALKEGRKAFQPGLLASAHRGVLYIDEVNLLADHLVDVLLDVAALGVNHIQREGLSVRHPARFSLIGTMNLEEGDLRPQLLDRFGLMVQVDAPREPELRAEVVRRRLAYEMDPEQFSKVWAPAQESIRLQVGAAQKLLPSVTLDDSLFNFISKVCCELDVISLRADIVVNKAARALAALSGMPAVTLDHVRAAAELVLPHRRRLKPTDRAGIDKDKLDDLINQDNSAKSDEQPAKSKSNNSNTQPNQQSPDGGERKHEQRNDNEKPQGEGEAPDEMPLVFGVAADELKWRVELRTSSRSDNAGRRSTASGLGRGQYVRAVLSEKPQSLAVDATLRHSVLRNAGELKVSRQDFHEKIRVAKNGSLVLILVDSSGSMAALKRMEAVKGAVISLLNDAYRRRDQVGVISCRGREAELLLPPTRSVELAEEKLRALPTGGRTPLAHALSLAASSFGKNAKDGPEPLLIVLSDGKANVSLSGSGDPWQQSLDEAGLLAQLAVPALVIDTESGYLKFGRARDLAEALRAEYVVLEDITSETLTVTIRRRLRGGLR